MQGGSIEVDYLVVGAGAAGMAFTDALLADSDATVLLVDRREAPGGHWNDAYGFVRLHQPSAFYGVNSRDLGADRIDETGPNAGLYERATAAEICAYYQAVLHDQFLASGRVQFLPMTTCDLEARVTVPVVSRVSGAVQHVTVRRKVVDARFLESSVPSTHRRAFVVDDGVDCVAVNDLVRRDAPRDGYVVMGTGKTGMDACVWLLEQGVDPDAITWVRPRDNWALDRRSWQPRAKVGDFIAGWAAAAEATAAAESIPDLFARLAECGQLKRIDAAVQPTMYRGATLSDGEIAQLAGIEHVVRAGHVRRIHTDRLALDHGDVAMTADRIYVDCTAEGIPAPPPRPVFEERRITLQQVRETSPTFNAALIGYLEATRDDIAEQNRLTPPNPYPSTATDLIRNRHIGMVAQGSWDQVPDLREWIDASRLNVSAGLGAHAAEPDVGAAIGRFLEHRDRAIARLAALRAQLGDAVAPVS